MFETEGPPFLEMAPQTLLAVLSLFKTATPPLCHYAIYAHCYVHFSPFAQIGDTLGRCVLFVVYM